MAGSDKAQDQLFAAGKYKSIGAAGAALTDEQRGWLQAQVDEIYADFKTAVLARGRRITPRACRHLGRPAPADSGQRLIFD